LTSYPGSRALDRRLSQFDDRHCGAEKQTGALAAVTDFIEEAKASGPCAHRLDAMGMTTSQIPPIGMKA